MFADSDYNRIHGMWNNNIILTLLHTLYLLQRSGIDENTAFESINDINNKSECSFYYGASLLPNLAYRRVLNHFMLKQKDQVPPLSLRRNCQSQCLPSNLFSSINSL